jgi:hypothetical protein
MTVSIAITQQHIEVDETSDVVVTEIEQDTETGDYVRDIRVYGLDADGASILVVQVKVRSNVHENIELTAPASEY